MVKKILIVAHAAGLWDHISLQANTSSSVWFDPNNNISSPGGRALHFMVADKNPRYIWLGNGQNTVDSTLFNRFSLKLVEFFCDLWRYDRVIDLWQPMLGIDATFVYLEKLTTLTQSFPNPRSTSNVWTDEDNNVWLFGGVIGTLGLGKKLLFFKSLTSRSQMSYTPICGFWISIPIAISQLGHGLVVLTLHNCLVARLPCTVQVFLYR
jgi:hypothetical protein